MSSSSIDNRILSEWFYKHLGVESETDLRSIFENKRITVIGAGSTLGRSLILFFNGIGQIGSVNLDINVIARKETLQSYISFPNVSLYSYSDIPNDLGDYVFFCASPASPKHYLSEPIETIRQNTALLLEIIDKLCPEATLIYLSTTGVYGEYDRTKSIPSESSKPERLDYLDPAAVYLQAKRTGEAICLASRRSLNSRVVIVRPSITFTPFISVGDNRLHSQVLYSLINRVPLELNSTGTQTRNFLFILDFIDALIRIVGQQSPDPIYNVTNPIPMSIQKYLSEVSTVKFNGYRLEVRQNACGRVEGLPFASTCVRNENIEKLGWVPKWGIKESYEELSRLYFAER